MEQYYQKENVNLLEIEMTSYCNAFCGACHRNVNGGELQPYVNLKHMDDETWDSIISESNLEYIDTVFFDGNIGDASMHPRLIPMLEKLSQIKSSLFVKITTNGGARNPQWWEDLSKCLNKNFDNSLVTFSIDGLEDTNHIYRRNVNWNKLIENVKSFNNAGGRSRWRSIIFDHNKHQIDEMAKKSIDLGFEAFLTFRNRQPKIIVDEYKSLPSGIITGPSVDEFSAKYKIFQKNKNFKTPEFRKIKSDIYSCPYAEEGKVAIDEKGNVWPCCFTSVKFDNSPEFPVMKYKEFNNIKNNSLETILDFFRNDLYNAWDKNSYKLCSEKCLHKYSPPRGL